MRVIADLHIHGRYSRATSQDMSVTELARFSRIKGLNLIGTGDFTHPKWLEEVREALVPDGDSGLYRVRSSVDATVRFMFTSEVSTVFELKGQAKKIHHVILAPDIDVVLQINDRLSSYGSLSSDGRPTLSMDAAQLVEEVMETSSENLVFPAHAWTPWFSLFGAFNGFDSVEECYQDMTRHVHALETGLSSDPPMNWRLSKLDRFTLVSNSDSHSFWPWRIGREANVFDLKEFSYKEVASAIREGDTERFKFTIETDPAYGKYHWTGHRACGVSVSPKEAIKLNNICPVCGRRLTKGVEQRVEELADRPAGFVRKDAPSFMRLLPLSEIIATVMGTGSPSARMVWSIYDKLVGRFGNEYAVLIDATREELEKTVEKPIADAILKVREGKMNVTPGFDGVYGQLVLDANLPLSNVQYKKAGQAKLADFM